MPDLFTPIRLGDLDLPNRIFMAPLTRTRSGPTRVPNALMADYYRQRASAGLILSEATVVSAQGIGYSDTPGIWSPEQVEGWKLATRAVHEAGGRIFLQLWHVGRVSHPSFLDGALPVAPSAIAPAGHVSQIRPETPYVVPRALAREELPGIVESFRRGAANAQAAGFDGVEIHGANGYLLDQFLQDRSNHRTDDYGGSIANRARLMLEVTDAVIGVWGAARCGHAPVRRAAMRTMWGIRIVSPRSAMWRASSGSERSPSSRPARSLQRIASARSSRPRSAASMLRTKGSIATRPTRCSPRATPTPQPSAGCSSRTPTCRGALPRARR